MNARSESEDKESLLGYTPRACRGDRGFRASKVVLKHAFLKLYPVRKEEAQNYVPETP